MTSEVATQEEEFNLGDLESLDRKVFTRPRVRNADLEALWAVASEVFNGRGMRESVAEEARLRDLVEMIAIILGKTYVERGDSFSLTDDQALTLINDLLLQYEPIIVARNRNTKLPKWLLR